MNINYNTNQTTNYVDGSQRNYATSELAPGRNRTENTAEKSTPLNTNNETVKNKSNGIIQPDVFKAYDEKTLKKMGIEECSTCENRKYQDGSDDSGVSFQSPTHVSASESFSAVSSHEQEHVVREQAEAKRNNGEVLSQSVIIKSAICPECGTSYSSGGVTKTTVRYTEEPETNYKGKMMDALV